MGETGDHPPGKAGYRREMKRLRAHRRRYYPAMDMLMGLHSTAGDGNTPVDITDTPELPVILELLDIGYIDTDALVIHKAFGTIERCLYNGRYPLTGNGFYFFKKEKSPGAAISRLIHTFFDGKQPA